ncbi:MAG: cysteine--tRNA ligase [Candidatus Lloydbacteria bacterium RIFCSPHIGHO2_01_FULL_49_22]|uniref:Cysteine--tRNA ligase n=1 Tax=Candidatus Lloydbacteria bacterium RIFCSPHIGHO2_01_FULL_49_22 TaxID=1798658 RepID=A0A1G2CUX4_9BACT|nr:MAG: cysteine--tRNA ligase [Candidatus Lloydbacteria bacterium RIFCSPHIGHO2_01_FULL_49_22]OGZ10315.1 MAG: cysteine--tRNA ligase [Candidatus Lloydbacteria bacterium RIFCSPHIGHO2_02_FULL_50_18]
MGLHLYNTATRTLEEFSPLHPPQVTMYNCGPTVYNYQHIGNMRSFVFADILRRTLEWNTYQVMQIVNITDVGHLVSDGDEGEDKMTIGARRDNKSVEEIITKYSDAFLADLEVLNIKRAASYPRATKYIDEQKQLITMLAKKEYTYVTTDGIYFDTSKFPRYPDFAKLDVKGLEAGTRVSLGEKKNITDFALWKFSPKDGAQREQEWDSPLGYEQRGFPGWHLECSAIAMKFLGNTLDIHTGGVDHIPVHHTNEIAQSESATGETFARYWLHNAHVLIDGEKMSKSLGNTYRLVDLHERGIPPLAYRYWLLTAHYRTQVNFTWEALAGAQSAYNRLTNYVLSLNISLEGIPITAYINKFTTFINDDLNTAGAIALIWKLTKDTSASDADKLATILKIDEVLGLGLSVIQTHAEQEKIPKAVTELLSKRKIVREQKNFAESDRLRDEIKKHGYEVKDTSDGQKLEQI